MTDLAPDRITGAEPMHEYAEADYRRNANPPAGTHILPGTAIEVVRPVRLDSPPEHVLFDFDGTLSLIREGWPMVMVPMMVEVLSQCGTGESPEALARVASDFVMELNGKQTIYQMIRLAEEVRLRGGKPKDPAVYKRWYHERLMERIAGRREALRSGTAPSQDALVPHSLELLDALRNRGLTLYLASGTDEPYVLEEAALLGLEPYFGGRIYGASNDYRAFSKAMVIERILSENSVACAVPPGAYTTAPPDINNPVRRPGLTSSSCPGSRANRQCGCRRNGFPERS